jgi:hypothetical protein
MNSKVGGPLVIPTNDKAYSFHGPTLPSSPPLFSSCSCDPSNANHIEYGPMSLLVGLPPMMKMISPSTKGRHQEEEL